MEVTVKKALVLAGVLLIFGTAARLQPAKTATWRTESWMEQNLPDSFTGYYMPRSAEKPNQTYDAGERQYKFLEPYGIVCRTFEKDDYAIDTVVIAGNDRDTFHDPYFCLPGQNWKITASKEDVIATKTRGNVPVSVITLTDPSGGNHQAVFCYKGPTKMHPTQNSLYLDWFLSELKLSKPPEGAFYRFMTVRGEVSEETLKKFSAEYLDAAYKMSGGVL